MSHDAPDKSGDPAATVTDVVIIGAGLSGIGAACHLQRNCPGKSFSVLESRPSMGGTWDLFRYPGLRSDSDMYTLGYNFKPWLEAKSIADGSTILNYVKEAAAENGIDRHIRYDHRLQHASWSSADALWTLDIRHADGSASQLRCNFLLMCAGYYSYTGGNTPRFKGRERFSGRIVHPQQWPEDLDYRGKRVVVVGSGATAVTLVPVLAREAAHVVMLQRSPTYMFAAPDTDKIARVLRKLLPPKLAYAATRWKNINFQRIIYKRARKNPEQVKKMLIDRVRAELGPDFDVEKHFSPAYKPWDQRLCLVSNSDLFRAVKSGRVSMVTDEIDYFTEQGILLKSGEELAADIIITATGLNPALMGEATVSVDGELVDVASRFSYRGVMLSDVPNLASVSGYFNASWTLRADLISEYVCRLLQHMDQTGARQCTPRLRPEDRNMTPRPMIEDFSAGYVQRMLPLYPRQGDHVPWMSPQDYAFDKKSFRYGAIEDGVLQFTNPADARQRRAC
jgi:cation diffusion facilitator CzcD-associated flavoprotein CzcO